MEAAALSRQPPLFLADDSILLRFTIQPVHRDMRSVMGVRGTERYAFLFAGREEYEIIGKDIIPV